MRASIGPQPACGTVQAQPQAVPQRVETGARWRRLTRNFFRLILKQMLNSQPQLDLVFQALSDPTRRAIVERLGRGPASVSQLAEPFAMSLPAVLQHVAVLEASGLVKTAKVGRVRTCQVDSLALSVAGRWIQERRTTWERRLDRLGAVLAEQPD